MKKSFTLSEALITLAIIGVLAAILIPVADSARPDKDQLAYKKALYSIQGAMANAMESQVYTLASNTEAYWKADEVPEDGFCTSMADALNTTGSVNCSITSSYDNPNFITTDGTRYWGLEGKFPAGVNSRTIYVDRKLSQSDLNNLKNRRGRAGNGVDYSGLRINIRYDGKVGTTGDESFDFENELLQDTGIRREHKFK